MAGLAGRLREPRRMAEFMKTGKSTPAGNQVFSHAENRYFPMRKTGTLSG
jgi:hypothetical protein